MVGQGVVGFDGAQASGGGVELVPWGVSAAG